jgi:hypothetical protein
MSLAGLGWMELTDVLNSWDGCPVAGGLMTGARRYGPPGRGSDGVPSSSIQCVRLPRRSRCASGSRYNACPALPKGGLVRHGEPELATVIEPRDD